MKITKLWPLYLVAVIVGCQPKPYNSEPTGLSVSKGSQRAVFADSNGNDPREKMLSTSYPWSAIGKIQMRMEGSWTYCTGTLVGKSIMLTAAHCVVENGKLIPLTFKVNYINGQSAGIANSKEIKVGTLEYDSDWKNDWAVVHLDRDLGSKQGWMGVEPVMATEMPLAVQYAGYSADFIAGMFAGVDSNCSIMEMLNGEKHQGIYGHNCSMSGGGSGGPLFSIDSEGNASVRAVNTRGRHDHTYYKYNDLTANISTMTSKLVETVIQFRKKYDEMN